MTRLVALFVVVLWPAATAGAQVAEVSFAENPRLIRCGQQPCFRILLDGVDAARNPVALPTDPAQYRVTDRRTKKVFPVFHVSPLVRPGEAVARRTVVSLLLFDVSGSMNRVAGPGESRYQAAVRVLRDFVGAGFHEGAYRWAVTGFHARDVAGGIQATRFVGTRAQVISQIDAIERPLPKNNTALYSAIAMALPLLEREKKSGHEVRLIVFTDGKNEVYPAQGDDPDLLGPEGLGLVRDMADRARIEIITIGFGAKGDTGFDEASLAALAWPTPANYHYAGNRDELARVFQTEGERLASRVQVSVGPVAADKNQLTEPVPLQVSIGPVSSANRHELPYVPLPTIGAWEYEVEGDEAKAFASLIGAGIEPERNTMLSKAGILAGFLVFFACAWFGVPRLIWPERFRPVPVDHVGTPPTGRAERRPEVVRRPAAKPPAAPPALTGATRVVPPSDWRHQHGGSSGAEGRHQDATSWSPDQPTAIVPGVKKGDQES